MIEAWGGVFHQFRLNEEVRGRLGKNHHDVPQQRLSTVSCKFVRVASVRIRCN